MKNFLYKKKTREVWRKEGDITSRWEKKVGKEKKEGRKEEKGFFFFKMQ